MMGRKADYRTSARLLWAAAKVVDDARILTRFSDDAARERFEDLEKRLNNLAGDLYWDRTYKKDDND